MIKAKFSKNKIAKYIAGRIQGLRNAIESQLIRVGEQAVKDARTNGQYLDQTGNLRSSIGYIILRDGQQINIGFPGDKTGKQKGLEYAKSLASEFPTGYVLIVVAGMEYAASVESKGFDVLSTTRFKAINNLKTGVERLKRKLK